MLMYESRVREELASLRGFAQALQAKFEAEAPSDELLRDAEQLRTIFTKVQAGLPKEAKQASRFERHMGFMLRHLKTGKPVCCRQDIDDICNVDIPDISSAFDNWCQKREHFDPELVDEVSNLLSHQEHDSAIRKSFVVLTTRLRSTFDQPNNIDGIELVNKIFGSKGVLASKLDQPEREATRDLLAGLFGVFRNKYGHGNYEPELYETEAVLAMVNFALMEIEKLNRRVGR